MFDFYLPVNWNTNVVILMNPMSPSTPRTSDTAVKKATGKNWSEWFTLLDQAGAKKMIHKDIARMLWDKKYIKSGWWCQAVTVEYEKARGLRTLGQTRDAGYEIGVQKTLPLSVKQAWDLLMSPKVLPVWLGVTKLDLQKGALYRAKDGTTGEIRSLTPGKHIRLTVQLKGKKGHSTLQIYMLPAGKNTSVRFHEERLESEKDRETRKAHWQKVLEKFARLSH